MNTHLFKKSELNTDFFTKPYFLLGSCRTGKTSLVLRKTWDDLDIDFKIYVGRGSDTEGWKHTHRFPFTVEGLDELYDIFDENKTVSILLDHNICESEASISAASMLIDILMSLDPTIMKDTRLILDEPSAYMSNELASFIQQPSEHITINYTYQSILQMLQQGITKLPVDNIIITGVVDTTTIKHIKTVLLPDVILHCADLYPKPIGNYHAIFDNKYYTGKLSHTKND